MRLIKRTLKVLTVFSTVLLLEQRVFADNDYKVGAQVGAVGIAGDNASSGMGYGAYLQSNPFGWAGIQIDAMTASLTGGNYFSAGPALNFFLPTYSELSMGLLLGPGFYKFSSNPLRFGVNAGVAADFQMTEAVTVGMQARYHYNFSDSDSWSVVMTAGFRFESGW